MKSQIKEIKEAKKLVDQLADEVARAETEVVKAGEQLAEAKADDGLIDPAELVQRIEKAKQSHQIREIEANRAGAKLAAAEAELGALVDQIVGPVKEALGKRAEEETDRIVTAITELVGREAMIRHNNVVGLTRDAPAVKKFSLMQGSINRAYVEVNSLQYEGARQQLNDLVIQGVEML